MSIISIQMRGDLTADSVFRRHVILGFWVLIMVGPDISQSIRMFWEWPGCRTHGTNLFV